MILFNDVAVKVEYKKVKNVYLKISREGAVKLTLPHRYPLDLAEKFLLTKKDWLTKNLKNCVKIEPLTYQEGEIHYFWGQAYPLKFCLQSTNIDIKIVDGAFCISKSATSAIDTIKKRLIEFKKDYFILEAQQLIELWKKRIGVEVSEIQVKSLKSKWGICYPTLKKIVLNTELVAYDKTCLEYVVVHELIHLLEPSHNKRFYALMTNFYPNWPQVKALLKFKKT